MVIFTFKLISTTAMLSQGNRAMRPVFPTPNDSSLQVPKGQDTTGLANMRLTI